MNTRQYHYLSTIAEYGSLSGAAAFPLYPEQISGRIGTHSRRYSVSAARASPVSHRGRAGCHRECTKYTV